MRRQEVQDDRGSAVVIKRTNSKETRRCNVKAESSRNTKGWDVQPTASKKKKPVATASGKSNGVVFQWEDVFLPAPRKHQLANSSKIKAFAGNTV